MTKPQLTIDGTGYATKKARLLHDPRMLEPVEATYSTSTFNCVDDRHGSRKFVISLEVEILRVGYRSSSVIRRKLPIMCSMDSTQWWYSVRISHNCTS